MTGLRWVAAVLAAALSIPAVGAAAEQDKSAVVSDLSFISPNRLVDIGGGRKMNLHCIGEGSPTVIFEAGLDDQSRAWATVQPIIAEQTRTCSYDRAGFGFSDLSHRDGNGANAVDDLHRLLTAASIAPPYVLVGHSMGGMYVRQYADAYLSEVVGMVLVDPVSEEQGPRYFKLDPTMRAKNDAFVESIRTDCLPAATKGFDPSSELFKKCVGVPDPHFSDAFNRAWLANVARPERFEAALSEWHNVFTASSDQARASKRSFGDMPLIVLTRAPFPRGAKETQEERDVKNHLWMELHDDLARLSSRGYNEVVPGAGHFIQLDRPGAVVSAIRRVIAATGGSARGNAANAP